MITTTFHEKNFKFLCNKLSRRDPDLKFILKTYGHPPVWTRTNSFATLIHIILEQQVSLASARAAFYKLKEKIGAITPQKLIALSDVEMKACYFSRQKMIYARHLAEAIISKQIRLKKISSLDDEEIRIHLKQIKGIGDWTVDVYLLFALQRANVFPIGDLAMMNALKEVKNLPLHTSKEEIIELAKVWQPYRSIATMLFWHYYIQKRGIKI
jgi:DNA-3-methyladenine glycosylase II